MRSQSSHDPPNDSAQLLNEPALDLTRDSWPTTADSARIPRVKLRTILFWGRCGKIKAHAVTSSKRRVWCFLQANLYAFLIHSRPVLSSAQPSVSCP
jgi:hypothetical protein